MAYTRERLGQLLLQAGALSREQLKGALEQQLADGGKLGQIMVDRLILTEEQLADTLASQKDLPRVTLADYPIQREAVAVLPQRVARRRTVIPVRFTEDGSVLVAMADPLDIEALDEVELRSGHRALPVVATASEIHRAIDKYMAEQDAFDEVIETTAHADAADEDDAHADPGRSPDVPVVRLVNQIIREALSDRASDIHFEPFEHDLRVRYRVDGVMHEAMRIPKSARREMTSRIKIMADMDITERRRPQDGRILLALDGQPIDLRVATLPTPHGESIVVRVLSQSLTFHGLDELGMNERHLEIVDRLLRKPYGAILIAGPTGSGKSTTLYAALKRLNDESRKVITIEEPVEYQMDGVTQIAVNNLVGLTFASGLRQVLRSDPDVVMIGEIRDPETAETAVRAALTGHLVLSSIHTNDAPSALTRLTDMGVAPYVTSSALLAVIAQRLVRRLCEACKQPVEPSEAALALLDVDRAAVGGGRLFGPVGCSQCLGTGYRGRVGIFEVMVLDDGIRTLFLRQEPADVIRAYAIERGMTTLHDDAMAKVLGGMTALEEVARVTV